MTPRLPVAPLDVASELPRAFQPHVCPAGEPCVLNLHVPHTLHICCEPICLCHRTYHVVAEEKNARWRVGLPLCENATAITA